MYFIDILEKHLHKPGETHLFDSRRLARTKNQQESNNTVGNNNPEQQTGNEVVAHSESSTVGRAGEEN